ncbi:MAG: PLD nuclease N-terminal domain-containing protein [Jatrophihabitantaceae bacterium]
MVLADGLGGLLLLGLWIFCVLDVLLTPDAHVRNLPKIAWLFIVLLLFALGAIAWLVAGRPWNRAAINAGRPLERARPAAGKRAPSNPDDDEEFLAGLRIRAEEQRRRAREQQERDGESG